ncbi:MAG: MFS transporter [Acidobacteria bacterium]|nr:MFS transporter [Acidobacteriota bacterium]
MDGAPFQQVVFSLIGGDLSDKFGRKTLIFTGWVIYAFVYAGFAFVTESWQAWALFIIYGAYFGLTEGVEKAFVADLVGAPEKRGTAFGFYNLAFSITVFPASLIFGALWTYLGAQYAFLISASISIAAAVLLLSIRNSSETPAA